MIKFIVGLIVGACLVVLGEYLFVVEGGVFMSTKASTLPAEQYLANHAISASIGSHKQDQSPIQPDDANLLSGAHIYQQNCSGCHGRLGSEPSPMSKRFYPHIPPLLPPSEGVTDDPVGSIHWIVENGIRFSAMPRFQEKLNDTETWQVALLLHNADKLPGPVQDVLRSKEGD